MWCVYVVCVCLFLCGARKLAEKATETDIKLVKSYVICGMCGKLFASLLSPDGSIIRKAECTCAADSGASLDECDDEDDDGDIMDHKPIPMPQQTTPASK